VIDEATEESTHTVPEYRHGTRWCLAEECLQLDTPVPLSRHCWQAQCAVARRWLAALQTTHVDRHTHCRLTVVTLLACSAMNEWIAENSNYSYHHHQRCNQLMRDEHSPASVAWSQHLNQSINQHLLTSQQSEHLTFYITCNVTKCDLRSKHQQLDRLHIYFST